MLKETVFSLVITAIIIFAGCNKTDSPVSTTTTDVLIPLKIGNTWIYQMNSQGINSIVTLKVDWYKLYNGEMWYHYFADSTEPAANRNDGFYIMAEDSSKNFVPTLLFKYPANINDTWSQINVGSITNSILLSKNDNINVNAGNFLCYKYQFETKDTSLFDNSTSYEKAIFWVYPGLGMIKYEEWGSYNTDSLKLIFSTELQSYILQ